MPKIAVSNETLLLSGVVYRDGCWLRMLGVRPGTNINGGGYSRLFRAGRTVYAHRLAYETWVGPLAAGMQIDHLCRNRNCINPEHLEQVRPAENARRGVPYLTEAARRGRAEGGKQNRGRKRPDLAERNRKRAHS